MQKHWTWKSAKFSWKNKLFLFLILVSSWLSGNINFGGKMVRNWISKIWRVRTKFIYLVNAYLWFKAFRLWPISPKAGFESEAIEQDASNTGLVLGLLRFIGKKRKKVKATISDVKQVVGPWWWCSSGQRARLVLQRSEFESRWSIQFFPVQFVFEKKEKTKRGRGWPI